MGGGGTDQSISALCSSLSAVLGHAESSSKELADAVSRRPIQLELFTSRFTEKVNRQADAAAADLERLESRALGAVSFDELLGHCGVALGVYTRHADAIQSRLASYGYAPPEVEPELEDEEEPEVNGGVGKPGWRGNSCYDVSSSALKSSRGRFDEDDDDDDALFEESMSMSLKKLGFSDASLAVISSAGDDFPGSPKKIHEKSESTDDGRETVKEDELTPPQEEINGQGNAFQDMIRASKEEYEQLPPYMKTLATWEELQEAVSKLNSYFSGDKAPESAALNQDDVGTIGLVEKRSVLSAHPAAAESINYGYS
ncbi:hypothetical protein ACP4OV_023004 [Aristida adscensionis]